MQPPVTLHCKVLEIDHQVATKRVGNVVEVPFKKLMSFIKYCVDSLLHSEGFMSRYSKFSVHCFDYLVFILFHSRPIEKINMLAHVFLHICVWVNVKIVPMSCMCIGCLFWCTVHLYKQIILSYCLILSNELIQVK